MRFVFILFSFLTFPAFCFDLEFDSIRTEEREAGLFVIHEVEEEETLFSIAKRYKSSIESIMRFNELTNNRIEIGQVLSVLFDKRGEVEKDVAISSIRENVHLVSGGETLYSISKVYDLKIRDLRRWNMLGSNNISPGQYLKIRDSDYSNEQEQQPDVSNITIGNEEPEGFKSYPVQTGESLHSIAKKRGVSVTDLKDWNNLISDDLRIGQKLMIKNSVEEEPPANRTVLTTKLNDDGFERSFEEGIAAVITEISTSKYLALHRSLPIGTELEVRNLMNNFVVHVKIIGKLPNTGINKNVLLRLSQPAFDQLRILDSKSRVEVSHFKE